MALPLEQYQNLVELRVDPQVKQEEEEDGHEITNFILKVWGMVENPEYNHLISWTSVSLNACFGVMSLLYFVL